jgi:hypothetical protein
MRESKPHVIALGRFDIRFIEPQVAVLKVGRRWYSVTAL